MPNSACRGLAKSHEAILSLGVLSYPNSIKVCIMGKALWAIKYTNFVFAMAGEKIKAQITPFSLTTQLAERFGTLKTTYWSLGVLGSPYKIMSVQRASPINGSDQFRGLSWNQFVALRLWLIIRMDTFRIKSKWRVNSDNPAWTDKCHGFLEPPSVCSWET